MLLDVNSPLPNESLDSTLPWTTYNVAYLNRTFAIVEAFKNYPNTLLFFSGNEVITNLATGGPSPPYIRVGMQSIPVIDFDQLIHMFSNSHDGCVFHLRLRANKGFIGSHARLEKLHLKALQPSHQRRILGCRRKTNTP